MFQSINELSMMDLLARKFPRSIWPFPLPNKVEELPADTFIKTFQKISNNELSFWKCKNDQRSVEEVVLALVSKYKSPDVTHLVLIPIDEIEMSGFLIKNTEGKTPVTKMKKRHISIMNLTLGSLIELAKLMLNAMKDDHLCITFNESKVKEILNKGLEKGEVSIGNLRPQMIEELKS